jgi:transposase
MKELKKHLKTDKEIAKIYRVRERTVRRWKNRKPQKENPGWEFKGWYLFSDSQR